MGGFEYGDPGSVPGMGNIGTGPIDPISGLPTSDPSFTPGTPGPGWGTPGNFGTFLTDLKNSGLGSALGSLFGGQYSNLAQMAAFGGLGALLNRAGGGNSTPPPVGYQGDIPKYTAVREQLPIPTVTESGQARRPGQGGIQYFTPIQYVPEGGVTTPTTKPQASAAQQAANEGLAALPYASGTRATDAQIAQLYQEVFGRAPDAQGLAFYRASGFSPSQIKEQLLASPEYKGMLGAKAQQYAQGTDANKEQIAQIYRDVLGREADAGGLSFYDSSKFSPEQIKADIMKSPEYRERAITQMYQDILGRAPDQGGLRFYMNPDFTLDQIKQNLLDSPERTGGKTVQGGIGSLPGGAGDLRKQEIFDLYKNILGREPDEGGLQFYMNPDFTLDQIANDLANSAEAKKTIPTQFRGAGSDNPKQFTSTGNEDLDRIIRNVLKLGGSGLVSNSVGDNFGGASDLANALGIKTSKAESNAPQDYGSFGFDQKLVDYLNSQRMAAASDGGVEWVYNPQSGMFQGKTMSGVVTATLQDLKKQAGIPGAASGGYMPGGIAMLAGGRYLRGPGDGVSDSIPAQFQQSGKPARLADGEFVIDARTVSEIGNGSSEAGARKLYAMMDRVHKARKTAQRGKPSGADKFLPK